jgi:hypothetical protein
MKMSKRRDEGRKPTILTAGGNRPLAVNATPAAQMLSIGVRKLWELSIRGEIPSVRIGRRRVRVRASKPR